MSNLSLVITSHNQRDHLVEAIESALDQSSPLHEIIVADDYSTLDDSVEVIRRYVQRYPDRIKAVFQPVNIQVRANRAAGLAAATGEWVAFLDGDDRLLPNFAEAHLAALKDHPGSDVSYSNLYFVSADGARMRVREQKQLPSGDVLAFAAAGRFGLLRSLVVRASLARRVWPPDSPILRSDGYVLVLRLAQAASFVYILEPLMEQREYAGSVSRRRPAAVNLENLLAAQAEAGQLTEHLAPAEQRRIQAAWQALLLEPRFEAALTGQGRGAALWILAQSGLHGPRQFRRLAWLARRLLAPTHP